MSGLLLARIAATHRAGGSPPTDPNFGSVLSLLHFDGSDGSTTFIDQKGKVWTRSGLAHIQGNALALDGSGSYLSTPGTDFVFGTGDFTIEFTLTTTQTGEHYAIDFYTSGQPTWQLGVKNNVLIWFKPGATVLVGTKIVNDGVPHRIAVSRVSGTLRFFVDGLTDGNASDATNYSYQSSFLGLGAQVSTRNSIYDTSGVVDEVRITKGVGRYTSAYSTVARFPDA